MKLRFTDEGPMVSRGDGHFLLDDSWDSIFRQADPVGHLATATGRPAELLEPRAPIGRQEVWAAGVTYFVSRDARVEESSDAGTADVYRRCYDAQRPELFFKATPHRVVGPGQNVRIRADSSWNVPEPELTLAISAHGRIFGYTIGNDMSSRDIEGENPLYLPQAKTYDGSAALGPEILVTDRPMGGSIEISLLIERAGACVFTGTTEVSKIKRSMAELVDYLTREATFPDGCFLMTGTGVVPEPDFTLQRGDSISISIDGIGTLTNSVA